MSRRPDDVDRRELAQHETAGPLHWFDVDRRGFLKLLGGGMLVLTVPASRAGAQETGRAGGSPMPRELSAWLHIGKDGRITAYTGKVEIGQNIRTSLAQQVAEELRVPVGSIEMVMADTDRVPFDMGTFGSRTTREMAPRLRAVAATARERLIDLAARRWDTDRAALSAKDGRIVQSASGKSLSYGELTRGEELVEAMDEEAALTPPSQWRVAGQTVSKAAGRSFVTGSHRYTSDMTRPGMLHGKVLRPASFRAVIASVDGTKAAQVPGVRVVVDGEFVGVVAPDAWTARRGLDAIEAKWKESPGQPSDRNIFDYLKRHARPPEGGGPQADPAVAQAIAAAPIRLRQTYTIAYIAHAPLEPRAAVAEWDHGKLTVWTGTQRPFAVRDQLAETFRIPRESVRVIVPDTGSAYGGKHQGDAAVEAARLAKSSGKPVRVVWSREEEFTWAYFRPAGVIDVASGASGDGTITAWDFHNYNSGGAGIETPYDVAHKTIRFHPVDSPLRQGSYRALAATANHFARESHMDELAAALGKDPLEFRLKNLKDARLTAVFRAAAEKFGWGGKPAAGRGFGIAGGVEKGGYVATCAEVAVDAATRRPRIARVVTAFECGPIVNPDGLRNQIEGCLIQGLGGALFEAVRFENGRILNPHFSQYRVPRLPDVPPIEIVLVDRKDLPTAGAGETPIVAIAPAIGNAIFAATKFRLTSLPMIPEGKMPEREA